jgi:hypothetical protein
MARDFGKGFCVASSHGIRRKQQERARANEEKGAELAL